MVLCVRHIGDIHIVSFEKITTEKQCINLLQLCSYRTHLYYMCAYKLVLCALYTIIIIESIHRCDPIMLFHY